MEGSGSPAVEEGHPHTPRKSAGTAPGSARPAFTRALVGDHQGMPGSQFPSNFTQLVGGASAEVNGSGSMKTPGGPHAGLPPLEPCRIDEKQGRV